MVRRGSSEGTRTMAQKTSPEGKGTFFPFGKVCDFRRLVVGHKRPCAWCARVSPEATRTTAQKTSPEGKGTFAFRRSFVFFPFGKVGDFRRLVVGHERPCAWCGAGRPRRLGQRHKKLRLKVIVPLPSGEVLFFPVRQSHRLSAVGGGTQTTLCMVRRGSSEATRTTAQKTSPEGKGTKNPGAARFWINGVLVLEFLSPPGG